MTDKAIEAAVQALEDAWPTDSNEKTARKVVQAYLSESVGDYGELVKAGREKKLNINAANQGLLLDAIERLVAERDVLAKELENSKVHNEGLTAMVMEDKHG